MNYDLLPEHIRGGARRWIEDGIPPGDFLEAVFRNQLCEAFGRADETNQAAMFSIVQFMYNEAPMDCRGTKYDRWQGWSAPLKGEHSEQ